MENEEANGMRTFLGAPVPASRFWVIKLLYGFLAVLCVLLLKGYGENEITETLFASLMFLAFYEMMGMTPTALVPMLNASCFKTPFTTTSNVKKLTNTCGDVGGSQDSSNQVVVLRESSGVWGSHFMGWKKGFLWFVYASMFVASFTLFYFSKDLPKWRKELLFTGSMLFLSVYELIGFNPVALAPMMKMLLDDTNAHLPTPPPT